MTKTALLGRIELAASELEQDLKALKKVPFNSAYAEYTCGDWRSCVLYNTSGRSHDAVISDTDEPAKPTENAALLPYVSRLIEESFDGSMLRYARIFRISNFGLIIPHRDYLELNEELIRIHVPLQTNDRCFNSDEDQVFHMGRGEVWYLDASRVHSAAAFSQQARIHLVMDFDGRAAIPSLLKQPVYDRGASPDFVSRPAFGLPERQRIQHLAAVASADNMHDVISIITKYHFSHDLSAQRVFDVLKDVYRETGDPEAIAKAEALEVGCVKLRTDGNSAFAPLAQINSYA